MVQYLIIWDGGGYHGRQRGEFIPWLVVFFLRQNVWPGCSGGWWFGVWASDLGVKRKSGLPYYTCHHDTRVCLFVYGQARQIRNERRNGKNQDSLIVQLLYHK
jgi:hypothetical protein